jgi:hypothetical protein
MLWGYVPLIIASVRIMFLLYDWFLVPAYGFTQLLVLSLLISNTVIIFKGSQRVRLIEMGLESPGTSNRAAGMHITAPLIFSLCSNLSVPSCAPTETCFSAQDRAKNVNYDASIRENRKLDYVCLATNLQVIRTPETLDQWATDGFGNLSVVTWSLSVYI